MPCRGRARKIWGEGPDRSSLACHPACIILIIILTLILALMLYMHAAMLVGLPLLYIQSF